MKKLRHMILLLALLFVVAGAVKAEAYTIRVNRDQNIVNVYDWKGKVVKKMWCSCGLSSTPTVKGTFRTTDKYRWHQLMGGVWGQYCTRIYGGYLFHSVLYRKPDRNTLIPSSYNNIGGNASHGCIRLRVKDAKWIYQNCSSGTKVIIGEKKWLKAPSGFRKISYKSKKDPTDK